MLGIHYSVLFLLCRLRPIEVNVAAKPYRQLLVIQIRRLSGAHSAVALKSCHVLLQRRISAVRHGSCCQISVIPLIISGQFTDFFHSRTNRLLDEDIIVEPAVTVKNRHKSVDLCAMRHMVRCVAWRRQLVGAIVDTAADSSKRSRDQVMYYRNTLCCQLHRAVRKQYVIVHQRRSVRNFNKDILADAIHPLRICIFLVRQRIVMEQVLRNACSLCLPVKPETSRTVMEMVSSNDHIDRRMHLDAANFRTRKVLFVVDMVNMIILDDREYTT